MTIVAGNGRFLMEYLHRCTEAHYQQPSLLSSNGIVLANYKLGLANTTSHWNTGVMVADNGPLYAYVNSIKNLPFPATIVIYNMNNAYTVFLINLMLF